MKLKCVDFFEDVKTYDDFTFNTILSDIPYNLGSQWVVDSDGSYQIKGKKKAVDFMDRWNGLDGPAMDEMFKEMFRITKYGGYVLLFGLDRQLGPLHYYATKNGFDINQSLYWYFVSNFPKATDAGKMIDKRLKKTKDRKVLGTRADFALDGAKRNPEKHNVTEYITIGKSDWDVPVTEPASDLAKVFDGYKYSKAPLKQMVETIMVFSKPTKNKSVLDDLIEWSEDVDLLNYCPKVGKKERNMGLVEDERNTHPTLKPINLIYEIAKLFKLPDIVNQKVYVPFSGSGSEIIGLLKAGYNHKNIYACELNKEYVDISKKRIKYFYESVKK